LIAARPESNPRLLDRKSDVVTVTSPSSFQQLIFADNAEAAIRFEIKPDLGGSNIANFSHVVPVFNAPVGGKSSIFQMTVKCNVKPLSGVG